MAITPIFLLARHRQCHIFEAGFQIRVRHHPALAAAACLHARGVERHLGAIEIVALERRLQNHRIRMAGDADEARHLLIAQLQQDVQDAVGRFHRGQVFLVGQAVHVDEVEVVSLQALEAAFQNALRFVAFARLDLGGQEDAFAASLHDLADALLATAVAVAVGGVHVGDAQVEGAVEGFQGFVFVRIHQEAAASAHGQDGDARAGASENAGGHGIGGCECGGAGDGRGTQKVTP
jgi:hypothetical protein